MNRKMLACWLAVAAAVCPAPREVCAQLSAPPTSARAQVTPLPDSRPASNSAISPDISFAEAIYTEEVLRDPAAAELWYRRVIADARATPLDRQRATMRLARCLRLMNRPDSATSQLDDLLRDPALAADVREDALLEMKHMPSVQPARLMPDDTLVYVELREPGRILTELAGVLGRAGLDEFVRQRAVAMVRRAFLTDISKSLNPSVLSDLGRIEGVGLGLHNVGFETVAGQATLRADVLFVVHTGDIGASALSLPWVLAGVLKADVLLDGVQFFTPGSAAPDYHFAFEEDLLVVCSDMRAGADAVLRHIGRRRGGTLYAEPQFQQRPAGMDAADTFGFYVNWPRLVDLAVREAPEARREDLDIIVDMLSLRQIGPIFGALRLEGDRGELELAANVLSPDALLYRLSHTSPLEPSWRRWVPADAIFGIASGLTPGDRRWRDAERFIVELDRVRRLRSAVGAGSQPAVVDPLAGLRRFEEAAQLSFAEHICRSINGFGVVLLDGAAQDSGPVPFPSVVIILDVDAADAWRRRIEHGLRRWLFGPLSEAPLPTKNVETPVGTIELLSLPRTQIGLAWQVQGRRVVLAFGVDPLVSYLERLSSERAPGAGSLRGQTENKYISLRIDELLRLYYNAPPRSTGGSAPKPLVIRTYERENRVRFIFEQNEISEALRALADVELSRP